MARAKSGELLMPEANTEMRVYDRDPCEQIRHALFIVAIRSLRAVVEWQFRVADKYHSRNICHLFVLSHLIQISPSPGGCS